MTVADRGAELHQQVLEQIEADVSAATLAPASYLHAHALRAEPEVGKSTRLGRVREELRVTSTQVQRSPAAWPSANGATSEGRPTRAGRQGGWAGSRPSAGRRPG